MAADPYTILGVTRSASEAEIKSAYRKLAKELHPDRNADNPKAAQRFSEITNAYDLLGDKDKRARFDRGEIDGDGNPASPFGAGGGGGGFGGGGFAGAAGMGRGGAGARGFEGFGAQDADLSDIFEGLFGGRGGAGMGAGMGGGAGRRAPQRGANVNYRLKVPFIDAATLAPQRIVLNGAATLDLKLPAGVEDGTQLRLKGKGEPGAGGPGDATVTVEVQPHPFFVRDGDDVRLDLPITLDEAVAGAKVKVPTVDGPVMLTVAPGSGGGKVLRLKGRGFTRKAGGRGDQLVTLNVALPVDLTELAERLEGWNDATPVRAKLGV